LEPRLRIRSSPAVSSSALGSVCPSSRTTGTYGAYVLLAADAHRAVALLRFYARPALDGRGWRRVAGSYRARRVRASGVARNHMAEALSLRSGGVAVALADLREAPAFQIGSHLRPLIGAPVVAALETLIATEAAKRCR